MKDAILKIINHNLAKGKIPCIIDDRFLWVTNDNKYLVHRIKQPILTLRHLEHSLFKDISSLNIGDYQFFSFYDGNRNVVEIGLQDVDEYILTDIKQFEDRIKEFELVEEFREWNKTYNEGYDNTFNKFIIRDNEYIDILCLQTNGEPLYSVTIYETLEALRNKPIFHEYLKDFIKYNISDETAKKIWDWIDGEGVCPLKPRDIIDIDDSNYELAKEHSFYECIVL